MILIVIITSNNSILGVLLSQGKVHYAGLETNFWEHSSTGQIADSARPYKLPLYIPLPRSHKPIASTYQIDLACTEMSNKKRKFLNFKISFTDKCSHQILLCE